MVFQRSFTYRIARIFFWFCLCGSLSAHTVNPFEIEFPVKKELTFEDYEIAQRALRNKDIDSLIDVIYPNDWHYAKSDVSGRCNRFLKQTMINRQKGMFPEMVWIPGEADTKQCVVLGCSFDDHYPELLRSLVEVLREVGYEGAIYYRIGGYPNPTGEEIRYAGVPYAFKMFMLEEAYLLGYTQVLWLDASAWPLNNLSYCFKAIEQEGIIFEINKPNIRLTLPQTRDILEDYCDVNLENVVHCSGWLMGFAMDRDFVKDIFRDYRALVRKGTPFISVTPEEMVISALSAKYAPPLKKHAKLMLASSLYDSKMVEATKSGVHFLIRCH